MFPKSFMVGSLRTGSLTFPRLQKTTTRPSRTKFTGRFGRSNGDALTNTLETSNSYLALHWANKSRTFFYSHKFSSTSHSPCKTDSSNSGFTQLGLPAFSRIAGPYLCSAAITGMQKKTVMMAWPANVQVQPTLSTHGTMKKGSIKADMLSITA